MSLHNFNSNTKSWKMYTNTLTSVSGDDLLVMPSYGKDLILEVSANNEIFFKKGTITKRFDNLVSDYLDKSFNSLNSQVQYILQEISGASVKDFITSGISNDLLIKSYDGRDIILEVSGNNEIIFKRGDFSYNLDDLIGGGSQSSDYATYNILDITGKIIFTDNSGTSGGGTSGTSGGSSNIVLTSINGNIIPSTNNTFKLGDVSKNWSNAYITDVSATNIEVSGNLNPLIANSSSLGSSLKSWSNAYIRDVSVTNIDVSGKLNVVGATKLANTLDVSGNVTFGGSNLYVPSSFTIDPIGHGDNTGTVLINGNLVVQGVTTTINSSVVDISDKMLVLASNASNSLQADGAGFEISGAKVNFIYNNSSASFRSSIGMSISGNVVPVTNSVGSLGSSLIPWSNAYIRDVSASNIEVSGNIVPLRDMSSNLGSSLKRWNNVFVNDLSVNTINGQAYSAGGGTVSNSVSYLYSDEFTLYSPEATNSRAMEIITPGSRFKRNYYLVPFNAKIESVIVEQIGETTPVTYLIDIWVNNSRSSTEVPRFLLTKNNVTSITLSNTNNSSTLNYSQQIAYYISAVPTANLIMYYPFSYNTQNVADRTTFKSAISDIQYADDTAAIKVGVASAAFAPNMSFTTEREIPFCGTGTENFAITANSNGYTLITFWLNPRIVNSGDVQIMSSGYYTSPGNFNNKGWYMSLKGAEGVSYQDETTVDGEGQTNLFGLYFYCLARSGTQDSAGIYNGNHEVYVTGPNTLPSYTWTHIALYITPYNVFLCYNGVMVARSVYGGTAPYYYYVQIPNSRMTIHSGMRSWGYNFSENGQVWNGYISDLRVYNTTTDFMGADALGTTTGVTMSYLTPFQTANISSTKYLATNSGILVADSTSFTETYIPDSGKIFVSIKETGANVSNLDERVSVRLLLSPAIRTGYYGTINIITVGPASYTLATGSWSTSWSGWFYSGSNIARTLPITDRLATPGSILYINANADNQNYIYNITATNGIVTATYVVDWLVTTVGKVVFDTTLVPGTTTSITIKARSISIPLSTP